MRRCGKSSLLEMISDELLESGIDSKNIISINLDKRLYIGIKKVEQLDDLIESSIKDTDDTVYLFIDEI